MSTSQHDHSNDSNPTATEIFRVFRQTITASIEGLRLLLEECADLRAELVVVHNLHKSGDGDGVFSARQRNRILELQEAAKNMQAVMVSFPCGPD